MSWFGIGVYRPKFDCNVGTLFRSAHMFGAKFVFTIGRTKYKRQPGDTSDATSHVPYFHYDSLESFRRGIPDAQVVCVEITEGAQPLQEFSHSPKSVYLLGNESSGIPCEFCNSNMTVKIETLHCLNVSVAGSIVMYDRFVKTAK